MEAKGAPGRLGVPDPRQLSPDFPVPARVRRPTPGGSTGERRSAPAGPGSARSLLLVALCRSVVGVRNGELPGVTLHVFSIRISTMRPGSQPQLRTAVTLLPFSKPLRKRPLRDGDPAILVDHRLAALVGLALVRRTGLGARRGVGGVGIEPPKADLRHRIYSRPGSPLRLPPSASDTDASLEGIRRGSSPNGLPGLDFELRVLRAPRVSPARQLSAADGMNHRRPSLVRQRENRNA